MEQVCLKETKRETISLKKDRNGKIELLRFLFSVIIVFHHSKVFINHNVSPFLGGSLAVGYFFFVSGYLMMATIEKKNRNGTPQFVGKETTRYLLKKWCAVIPESLISWTIAFSVMSIAREYSLKQIIAALCERIWEPLFITMTGLGQRGTNGVVWYISAMLLCMAILYPLLRKYHDVTIHLIIPMTSMLILGWLFRNYSSPRGPTEWLGWAYKGVLRAFAEIGIGCLLFYLSCTIRNISFNQLGRWLVTVIETACYLIVIAYMYLQSASDQDYFFILVMAIGVALTFSEAGIDKPIFNNKFVYWLGRFSVPLYFSHLFWANDLEYYIPVTWRVRYKLLAYLVLSVVTAFVVMMLARFIRSISPTVYSHAKKLVVTRDEIDTEV